MCPIHGRAGFNSGGSRLSSVGVRMRSTTRRKTISPPKRRDTEIPLVSITSVAFGTAESVGSLIFGAGYNGMVKYS
jgi:hypothetical protein